MPSFDVVVSVNKQEVVNALDQVQRELITRYDFKDSKSKIDFKEEDLEILADDDMKLKAIQEMLKQKLAKRSVSLKNVEFQKEEKAAGDQIRQIVKIKQALASEELKMLSKTVRDSKIKVTASIQGDQLRVTGKKRDDLQECIQYLKSAIENLDLQFVNFRD